MQSYDCCENLAFLHKLENNIFETHFALKHLSDFQGRNMIEQLQQIPYRHPANWYRRYCYHFLRTEMTQSSVDVCHPQGDADLGHRPAAHRIIMKNFFLIIWRTLAWSLIKVNFGNLCVFQEQKMAEKSCALLRTFNVAISMPTNLWAGGAI